MSGYKQSGVAQAEYQAKLAWAVFNGRDPDEDDFEDWDALPDAERVAWLKAAEAVRHDTRTEPRW